MNQQDYWRIHTKSDVDICVWPWLEQMSTYVLLEQEDWFEDEMDFIRGLTTPGMNAFDIGANHGVYALNIAARAPQGQVWAFEPTTAAGSMLEKSITLNGFKDRLHWIHAGLSDHAGNGQLAISLNTELSTLHDHIEKNHKTEIIRLITLDGFIAEEGITSPIDFVKLDVEGEEINVLHGGQRFFQDQSPLVMFELRHGEYINHGLIEAFQAMGYDIYRLIPGLGILTDDTDTFQDDYLLNLFACKPDRRAELQARGLLATGQEARDWMKHHPLTLPPDWEHSLLRLPYAQAFASKWRKESLPKDYLLALTACLQAEDLQRSAPERLASLYEALEIFESLATQSHTENLSMALTQLTLLHRWGHRVKAAELASIIIDALDRGSRPHGPFMIPLEEFATPSPTPTITPTQWLRTCLMEFFQRRYGFSSYFTDQSIPLSQLIDQPDQPASAIRRALLVALKRRETDEQETTLPINHPLLQDAHSPNAPIWRQIVHTVDRTQDGISPTQPTHESSSFLGRLLSVTLNKILHRPKH